MENIDKILIAIIGSVITILFGFLIWFIKSRFQWLKDENECRKKENENEKIQCERDISNMRAQIESTRKDVMDNYTLINKTITDNSLHYFEKLDSKLESFKTEIKDLIKIYLSKKD